MRMSKKVSAIFLAAVMLLLLLVQAFPAYAAAPMFYQEFDADIGKLSIKSGNVTVARDGETTALKLKGRAGVTYAVPESEPGWNDSYSASFKIKMADWSISGTPFQISFNTVQNDHKYLLNYSAGGFNFAKMTPPMQYKTVVNPTGAMSVNPSKYHTVKINVLQNKEAGTAQIIIYFDGEQKITYTDTENICTHGGFMIDAASDDNEVLFDSIKFTSLTETEAAAMPGGIPTPDVTGFDYEREATVLRDLGIMEDAGDGMWDADRIMSRAEYVDALVRLLGYDESIKAFAGEHPFVDVDKESEFSDSIALAYGLKIVDDDRNHYFQPNEAITYTEALVMAVRALGYRKDAESKGGNPAGYKKVASQLKLPVDTESTVDGLRNDIAMLLFECLEVPIKEPVAWCSDYVRYAADGETVLSQRDIITDEAIITANYIENIKGSAVPERGQVNIDNVPMQEGATRASDYLGYSVRYYAKEDKYGTKTLIYAAPSDENNVWVVKSEDISADATSSVLSYYDENDKKIKVSVSAGGDLIYNGAAVDKITREKLVPKDGYVVLVDNNRDKKADVIFSYDFETIVVESASVNAEVVYDTLVDGKTLDLSEDSGNTVDIIKDGEKIEFKDIQQGEVISYYISGKGYTYATISSAKAGGVLEGYKEKEYVKVNGNKYVLSARFIEAVDGAKELKPVVGSEYTFLLNSFGKVVSIAESSYHSGSIYAWARRMAEDGVFKKEYTLELFTQDGEWEKVLLRDKLKWNEVSVLAEDFAKNAKIVGTDGVFIPQLIEYKTDYNGNIVNIKTAVNESEAADPTNMLCLSASEKLKYKSVNKSLGSKHFISQSKIFKIPNSNIYDDDFYEVISASGLSTGASYTADFYNEIYAMPEVVVIHTDDTYSTDPSKLASVFVVENSGQVLDAETDEIYTSVTGWYGGKQTTLKLSDAITETVFNTGDVLQYKTNAAGVVVNVAKRYDAKAPVYLDDGGFDANMRLVTGRIVYINRDRKLIAVNLDNESLINDNTVWMSLDSASLRYYTVDSVTEQVGLGSIDDLDKGAIVFGRLVQEQLMELVINI